MRSNILMTYGFNLMYAKRLLEGVTDDHRCSQPAGVPNHATWVIGHLAKSTDFAGSMLGIAPACPDGWGSLFGKDSVPDTDATRYPDLATLMAHLEQGHDRVAEAYRGVADDVLGAAATAGPKELFPTVGDLLHFIVTSHETLHLGQLSSWRRAAGLPSVF